MAIIMPTEKKEPSVCAAGRDIDHPCLNPVTHHATFPAPALGPFSLCAKHARTWQRDGFLVLPREEVMPNVTVPFVP